MNDDRRIAQLEALLARIRSRSRPLRASPQLPGSPPPHAPHAPPPSRPSRPGLLDLPTPHAGFRPAPLGQAPTAPPPFAAAPSAPARPKYAPRPEVPVVGLFPERPLEPMFARPEGAPGTARLTPHEPPPMEVVELEVDPDPSIPPPPFSDSTLEDTSPEGAPSGRAIEEPLESRSRLVSAPPVPPESLEPLEPLETIGPLDAMEGLDVGNEPPGLSPSDPTIEVAAAEVSRSELDELEEDSAPSSSRRPISLEAKMSEPDDDVAPLHTPPPESGRHPAALPNFELSFETVAPERSEVTLTPVEAPARSEPSAVRAEASERSERKERDETSVIRAEPPDDAEVAVFVASPRTSLGRKTFGDLLDDALSL